MTPRPSCKGDENALKALWREVFGDTDEYIDAFFQNVYQPGMASVIEEDGTVVAAAYAVPFGAVRYIFAVATRPKYRGRGYGRAVVYHCAGWLQEKNLIPLVACETHRESFYAGLGFQKISEVTVFTG